jgi:two-component system sensor histidine kinase UhpB
MAAQIQADQERLRDYASAVTDTQEAERKRLARELHDDTIQSLIVLSQRIQTLRLSTRDTPGLAAKLDELRAGVLQMIDDVRRFSRALRPIYLEDAGLVTALERLAQEANGSAQQDNAPSSAVAFHTNGLVVRLKPEVELALFRITQEALANALRHARATDISVNLDRLPNGGVRLCVRDNGQGFALDTGKADGHALSADMAAGGFGLKGIRERALLIGAQVDLATEVGQGTQLVVIYQP